MTSVADADRRLVDVARDIHLLGALAWSPTLAATFVVQWRLGQPRLPQPERPRPVDPEAIAQLHAIAALPRDEPRAEFIGATADSYLLAARIVGGAGTPEGFAASRALFGDPQLRLPGSDITQRAAAERLLEVTEPLEAATRATDTELNLDAEEVATMMRARFEKFFGAHAPTVVLDPNLSAKAAASADRVRLRQGASFSPDAARQLVEHEGLVHAATALNGRHQPNLRALSLSAPRTTVTQEGLATLAELVTGTMDLTRLRRIALRVVGIDMAIGGADFIEVARFFHEQGQTKLESANSAARVFRGGDVRGRWVFTKDAVYLRGLFAVHTFARRAIADARPQLIARLFVGRLTLGDVLHLEPCFADGTIAPAVFVPRWAAHLQPLAAYLSFSALLNRIDLSRVDLQALWDEA